MHYKLQNDILRLTEEGVINTWQAIRTGTRHPSLFDYINYLAGPLGFLKLTPAMSATLNAAGILGTAVEYYRKSETKFQIDPEYFK